MIAVFFPGIILEISSTYLTVKCIFFGYQISIWTLLDLLTWFYCLVVPSVFAIYLGATLRKQGKLLADYLGKYANHCNDSCVVRNV
jgi:hypothetical protein